ncbi:MAG: hypothetical protein J6Z11_06590, partial [Candidatus Riflebacteria bacterium]|nr:hypothetical protein [Candidatus Riflebacteria bacterium]
MNKNTTIEEKNKDLSTPVEELPEFEKQRIKKKLILSSITVIFLVLFSSWFYVHGDSLFFSDTKFLMNTAYTIKV